LVIRLRKRSLAFGILAVLVCLLAGTRANAQGNDLFNAARDGDLSRVKGLLASGADVNVKNSDGATALFAASFSGHLDVVQALLANGAQVNVKSNGATAQGRRR
jgi:ankyrin repeat protein